VLVFISILIFAGEIHSATDMQCVPQTLSNEKQTFWSYKINGTCSEEGTWGSYCVYWWQRQETEKEEGKEIMGGQLDNSHVCLW